MWTVYTNVRSIPTHTSAYTRTNAHGRRNRALTARLHAKSDVFRWPKGHLRTTLTMSTAIAVPAASHDPR